MQIKKDIPEHIFREYDIRGIYPTEIDEDTAYTIGLSYGSYVQQYLDQHDVIVGMDNRVSSPSLTEALIKGITETGCNVINLGLCITPMNYYFRAKMNLLGIQVTASHNPKEYNGFKFSFDNLSNARGDMVFKFRYFTQQADFLKGNGLVGNIDIKEEYTKYLLDNINMGDRRLKVVIDPGNGTAADFMKPIHDSLNLDVTYINDISDGTFPNHHPDPNEEKNMEQLREKVLELNADVGIGYDGDADRVGFIDELGNFILPDQFMIIIARDLVDKLRNKEILFDIKCSKALEDEIIKLGLIPYEYNTGASHTKAETVRRGLDFGGEYSGHLYFNDRIFATSCGLYAGLRLLEILSHTDKTFSQLLEGVVHYESTPEIRIKCGDDKKFNITENIKKYCLDKNYKINDIDGVKVKFDDGWALVRASNTSPQLTTRFEATTKMRLEELKKEFMDLIEKEIQ